MNIKLVLYPALLLFFFLEPKITEHFTVEDGLPHDAIRSVHVLDNNKVWAGTPKGPAYFDGRSWLHENSPIQNIKEGIPSIYSDSRGRIWLGSVGFLYVYYEDGVLSKFSIEEDLKLDARLVFSVFEDERNRIWAATTGGATLYESGTWTTFTEKNGLSNNVVHDVAQDAEGRYWFATRKGGLNIYDGNEWSYFLPEKNCRKILRDTSGNMWVGTSDGIVKYDGSGWKVLETGKTVIPMFEGAKGTIWATTDSREVLRVNRDGKIIRYDDLSAGKANIIYHLSQNKNGTVWAGTDNGILVFE